jgi:protein-tyrosine kinase
MTIFDEPLLKLIARLEARNVNGVQELRCGDERIYVYFFDGKVEAVSSSREEYRLGQYLLRAQLIPADNLGALLRKAEKARIHLGELLVREGVVDSVSLTELVTQQAVDVLSRAMALRFEAGAFTGSTQGSMKHPINLTHRQLALEMARSRPVNLQLTPGQVLLLAPLEEMKSLGWSPEEVSVLSHLQQPLTVEELRERSSLELETLLRIAQTLLDLGLLRAVESVHHSETALVRRERLPLDLLVPEVSNPQLTEKVGSVLQEYSAVSEQFRALKVRLINQVDPPVRVLSITSPHPQDGKSLVSTNLALNFAREPGRRVLLIDADLRNASVHEKLGITLGPGLYHYLLGGLEPLCYVRRVHSLYVMTAGELAENAVELLSLKRMRDLIEFGRKEFDTVIVDASPLLPVADARIIANLTDASLLVVYQGKTPYRLIERALELVGRQKLLGVVLNGVRSTGLNGYYSYGYYYAYPYPGTGESKQGVIELKARPRRYSRQSSRSGSILFK